jgi:Acyltransferase family
VSSGLPSDPLIPRASLALDNLRALVILLVLAFHSVLAYLNFLPASPFPFDSPPYLWRSFPIVDSRRWFGFDLFCAWQDVFLMSLFFFLSGLFVWRSLSRKGTAVFFFDRVLRIGLPFALVVALLMPAALYPTYLQTAVAPGLIAYWRHWLALPFWPSGPVWFLWLLLLADIAAVGLHNLTPRWGETLVRLSSGAGAHPARYFAGLLTASALAYIPLAVAFTSSQWFQYGPFGFQLSRPLHYAVYFFAGAGIGAGGIRARPPGRRWTASASLGSLAYCGAGVVPAVALGYGADHAGSRLGTVGAANPRRSQLCRGLSWQLFFHAGRISTLRHEALAGVRQPQKQRLWHVSAPLCIRRLVAVCVAPGETARHP